MKKTITVIPGDGIGPEIIHATVKVLEALNCGLEFEIHELGEKTNGILTDDVLDSIRRNGVALKGPTKTPEDGHISLNVQLRRKLDLYANVRPLFTIPGVITLYSIEGSPIDLVIVRENTEGEYAVTEKEVGDTIFVTSKFTKHGCERIAKFALQYALQHNRKKICVGHKSNIIKKAYGMFRSTAHEEAKRHIEIEHRELIIDTFAFQLARNPRQFDILLLTNLMGDILSDLCAGIVHGSLGLAPGANIGDKYAVFEAVHGTAEDIAGKDLANPTAMLLSATMMLEHLGMHAKAEHLRQAINNILTQGWVTKDINRERGVNASVWVKELIKEIKNLNL